MMTLNEDGNYLPWVQPAYGTDAQDKPVAAPEGFSIVLEDRPILSGDIVFDVYAGWIIYNTYL